MDIIEISDEEIYDTNKDTQNIQMLPINSDSSSDNDSTKETEMAYFTKNLGVSTVIYSTVPVEYPATSLDGVATIFSIQGWKNHLDAFNDIQYSIGGGGGSPIQKCPFFGNIPVTKYVRGCQGIKHCSFANSDLINAEHCEVDFESDIYKQINKNNNGNSKENYTYITFLAARDSRCKFKQNGIACSGQPKLIRLLKKESYGYHWIIGCTDYKPQEQWHRYIDVDVQKVDIDLLRKLFNGETITEINANQCSTIISKSSRTKKCAYIHHCDGSVMQGKIVDKPCNVKMYKIIPNDLQECPFVALICIGIHNHPPPPPERTPDNIKDNLQIMIKEAIEKDDIVTSGSIIQGNMLKAYFNKETLQEIHMSLNNIDKLRYLVAKTYKNLYPFGQHILGVFQSVYSKQFDLHNYIHKIDFFGDGLVLVICMLKKQAQLLQCLECFQIDLSFKRVKGNINEFEINSYDDYHNLILSYCRIYTNVNSSEGYYRLFITLFDVIKQLTGKPIQVKHIHGNGWSCILGDLDIAQMKGLGLALHSLDTTCEWEVHIMNIFKSCQVHFQRNLHNKYFSDPIKRKMISLLKATSQVELNQIFSDIEKSNENGVKDWIDYYQRPHILATINPSASLMDIEIWNRYGNNTNTAEAAHSLVNRTGKQLKLLPAILRGRKLDERHLKIIEIQDFSGVPYTKQDKSQVKRQLLAINRKEKRNQKNNEDKNSLKRKPKIQSTNENDYEFEGNNYSRSKKVDIDEKRLCLELEIEERKMSLRERDIALRKAAAEVEAIEIANEKAKLALKID